MRKRNKMILWPVFFDSTKKRSEGRRVPRRLGVPAPKLSDIQKAVEKLGLDFEVVPNAAYPRFPWKKTGYISVVKRESKSSVIRKIAKELSSKA